MQPDADSDFGAVEDVVELSVPATAGYVGPLRLMAATLAARSDLTIDEIEDLRLAVDEACALLLPHALAGAPLVARFAVRGGALRFGATVQTSTESKPDQNGFSWSILSALAEDLQVDADPTRLSISFGKRREAPTGAA
jgi:serine/threonine-protein kinase RsbW